MAAININNRGAGSTVELTNPGGALQVNGTDVAILQKAQTWTKRQYFSGDSSGYGALVLSASEVITYSSGGIGGGLTFDTLASPLIALYDGNAVANWSVNLRGNSSVPLNSVLGNNNTLTFVVLATQGSTAYYPVAFYIDGTLITPKWQGGSAPTSGNANSVDVYTYTVVKLGPSTYRVFASQSKFA